MYMSSPTTLTEERGKIRFSLDITPETNALLESMANSIGGTKSDVLRKGIALMQVAIEAKRQGKKFGIAEKDQPLATEIVGL
jgi:hypothetical protein